MASFFKSKEQKKQEHEVVKNKKEDKQKSGIRLTSPTLIANLVLKQIQVQQPAVVLDNLSLSVDQQGLKGYLKEFGRHLIKKSNEVQDYLDTLPPNEVTEEKYIGCIRGWLDDCFLGTVSSNVVELNINGIAFALDQALSAMLHEIKEAKNKQKDKKDGKPGK